MPDMSTTFEVLNFETSISVSLLHELNIELMYLTKLVSKLLTSKEVNP